MSKNKRRERDSSEWDGNETSSALHPNQVVAAAYGLSEDWLEGLENIPRPPEKVKEVVKEVAPEGAIVPHEDGQWSIGKFTLTPIGIVIPPETKEQEWEQLGEALGKFGGAVQWLIGDWLLFGERRWKKTYEDAAEKTGYEIQSLRDMVYVANNVSLSVRTDKLTFAHHKYVSALSPNDQSYWLNWAIENKATSKTLFAEIGKWRKSQNPPTLSDGVIVDATWDKGCSDLRRMIHKAKSKDVPQMKAMLYELISELDKKG